MFDDEVHVSIYGGHGPDDKFNLRLPPYEWHILRTEFANKSKAPVGTVIELVDVEGDEFFFALDNITTIWKRSPKYSLT